MAGMLVNDFNGKVPMTVDELIKLPGVGRKNRQCNYLRSRCTAQYGGRYPCIPRISKNWLNPKCQKHRWQQKKQLIQFIPKELVHIAHHWLILHGRYTCVARSPKCEQCGLQPACKYFKKNNLPRSIITTINK